LEIQKISSFVKEGMGINTGPGKGGLVSNSIREIFRKTLVGVRGKPGKGSTGSMGRSNRVSNPIGRR